MKWYFILCVFLYIIIVGCSDDNNHIKPDDTPKPMLFDIAIGNRWVMKNDNSETTFEVVEQTNSNWVLKFKDTANQVEMESFIIMHKEFDNGFPRHTEYALARSDSGYFWGTRKHPLVAPLYPSDFFVVLFFIPAKPISSLLEYYYEEIEVFDNKYHWLYQASWTNAGEVLFDDALETIWSVSYYAEEKLTNTRKAGEEYAFLSNIGFYKFRNYVLTNYYK